MNQDLIQVALVIPVHNRRETTLQCLRSLARVDVRGLSVRIFVVDDGSVDGTSDAIRNQFPDVELIAGDGTLHYAAGTNRGIEAALEWRATFIVTMNDDAVFHDQFLQRLVTTASENPRSIVGSLLLLWDRPHQVFQVGQVWRTWKGGWQIPNDLTAFSVGITPFHVECIVGNCVMFPANAIRECGLLDEARFPHGWGDAQYAARLRKAQWNLLIDPRSLVWCEPNTYPPPLHTVGIRPLLEILFLNERHPGNLKRQFLARWESAPTRIKAFLAFCVYCLELLGKSLSYAVKRIVGN